MTGAYSTLAFDAARCDGCNACMVACAQAKAGSDDLVDSRIQIVAGDGAFELALCRQCGDPKCVANCPAAALAKDEGTGIIDWDGSKCVDCLLCTVGCAYGGIVRNQHAGHVVKCDLCGGDLPHGLPGAALGLRPVGPAQLVQ